MFASSNFFWECLSEINMQMIDFEADYPNLRAESKLHYQRHATGNTPTGMFFNKKSTYSLDPPEFDSQSLAIYPPDTNSGGTYQWYCK